MVAEYHDRRGSETPIKMGVTLVVIGLLLVLFPHWNWVGSGLILVGLMNLYVTITVSAPPRNHPEAFVKWSRHQAQARPVLLCLGDSLLHGTMSAPVTPVIPIKLARALRMAEPTRSELAAPFSAPVWVINGAQNAITSHTTLHDRLPKALATMPDYILIMIGTNDMLAAYKTKWSKRYCQMWNLPEPPSLFTLERNLREMLDFIIEHSPTVQVGLCTIPPLGEDLTTEANLLVIKANQMIERLVAEWADHRITLVPIYAALVDVIEKRHARPRWSVDSYQTTMAVMTPCQVLLPCLLSWDKLASLVGHVVLTDGVHLNETGRDAVVDTVVDWLIKANMAKAIAVKGL